MSGVLEQYDLSKGNLWTQRLNVAVAKSRAEQVIEEIYDEFSGDAPIQEHLIEFSAYYHLKDHLDVLPTPNLSTLQRFEYLKFSSIEEFNLRTKGTIALSMVYPELVDGQLSAYLVEPFRDIAVLPSLYRRWKAKKNGQANSPLSL